VAKLIRAPLCVEKTLNEQWPTDFLVPRKEMMLVFHAKKLNAAF
jgi:hypothetical protein